MEILAIVFALSGYFLYSVKRNKIRKEEGDYEKKLMNIESHLESLVFKVKKESNSIKAKEYINSLVINKDEKRFREIENSLNDDINNLRREYDKYIEAYSSKKALLRKKEEEARRKRRKKEEEERRRRSSYSSSSYSSSSSFSSSSWGGGGGGGGGFSGGGASGGW